AGLCLSDGLLLVCWPLCRSCSVLRVSWFTGRQPPAFFLSANAWCFSAVGHIAALLICAASTFHACLSFQLPNFQCL
ncbi:hypothetical protein, partial [Thiolapillus sp.]|uniref:hypothetical protein n=1 Tax=Thiolapillus sp. TaxID=2017437 RepID=UPI003AF838A3